MFGRARQLVRVLPSLRINRMMFNRLVLAITMILICIIHRLLRIIIMVRLLCVSPHA